MWVCIPTKIYKQAKLNEHGWSNVLHSVMLRLVCMVGSEKVRNDDGCVVFKYLFENT